MNIDEIQKLLGEYIDYIINELADIKEFIICSYVHDEVNNSEYIALIIPANLTESTKSKINQARLNEYLKFLIKTCRIPNYDDSNFNVAKNFLLAQKNEYIVSREKLLAILAQKYVALGMGYWLSKKLKYKINNSKSPAILIHMDQTPGQFLMILRSLNMNDDGLIFSVESELEKRIHSKFGNSIDLKFLNETSTITQVDDKSQNIEKNHNENLPSKAVNIASQDRTNQETLLKQITTQFYETIDYIHKDLSHISEFLIYPYNLKEDDKINQIYLIIPSNYFEFEETKIPKQRFNEFMEYLIKAKKIPEGNNFQIAKNFLMSNKERYTISQDQLLYTLARKTIGLENKLWISQKIKYALNDALSDNLFIHLNKNPQEIYLMIRSLNMVENGDISSIESLITKGIKEKFNNKINLHPEINNISKNEIAKKDNIIEETKEEPIFTTHISEIQKKLREYIEFIINNLPEITEFIIYSYPMEIEQKTSYLSLCIPSNLNISSKSHIDQTSLDKYMAFLIKTCRIPNFEDPNFNIAKNYLLSNKNKYSMPRDRFLAILAQKYAALGKDYWLSKKLKYKISNPENPPILIHMEQTSDQVFMLLRSLNMIEDGIFVTIENELTNIIQKEFGDKINLEALHEQVIENKITQNPEHILDITTNYKKSSRRTLNITKKSTTTIEKKIPVKKAENKKKKIVPKKMSFGIKSNKSEDENVTYSEEEKMEMGRKRLVERRQKEKYEDFTF